MLRTLRALFLDPNLIFPQIRSPISFRTLSETVRVKSDKVVSFLKAKGFSDDHITRMTKMTRIGSFILSADPQKNLAPKFDFFRSLGISNTDLVKIISSAPCLLKPSLKNQLVPSHRYLKSILHTDENVATALKRSCMVIYRSIDKILAPNISLLREVGVPESRIQYVLMHHSRTLLSGHTRFKSKVKELVSLGFDPTGHAFLDALKLLCLFKKTTIDRKWAVYKKLNLSDYEIRTAFRSFPNCMALSEENITRTVDFLVNKMGFEAVRVMASPVCIGYSLENRIIPRCRVIKVLQSHGFLKKDIGLSTFLSSLKPIFLERFVSKYEDIVPGLLKVYKGKMNCLETGTGTDNVDVTK